MCQAYIHEVTTMKYRNIPTCCDIYVRIVSDRDAAYVLVTLFTFSSRLSKVYD